MNEWRPIPSWPAYEASSAGAIRRLGGQPLKPWTAPNGYLKVALWRDGHGTSCWVHRLVCAAFHGAGAAMDAAHSNGNRADNRAENLRWATRAENEHDKRRHGRDNTGSRNGQALLDEVQVAIIRARVPMLPRSSGGKRIRKGVVQCLAAEYGVSTAALQAVISGAHWRHV